MKTKSNSRYLENPRTSSAFGQKSHPQSFTGELKFFTRMVLGMAITGAMGLTTIANAQLAPIGAPQSSTITHPKVNWNPAAPRSAMSSALSNFPYVDAVDVGQNGTPQFLRGDFGKIATSGAVASSSDASALLARAAPIFGLAASNLQFSHAKTDKLGFQHFFYDVVMNGRPVLGSNLILHVNSGGNVYCINATAPDEVTPVPTSAAVSASGAHGHIPNLTDVANVVSDRLVYFMDSSAHLHLAWETAYSSPTPIPNNVRAYVDATTGKFIDELSDIHWADNRNIADANGSVDYIADYDALTATYNFPGTLSRSEGGSASGIDGVDKAYDNIGTTYSYYSNTFGQDGQNNAGAAVYSAPNSLFEMTLGGLHAYTGYNSFYYWDGSNNYIYLGTGTANSTSSSTTTNASTGMAEALDVVGHEYTHGITQHMVSGSLGYTSGENADLNEGLSDVFGTMVKLYANSYTENSNTWKMGYTLSGVIRDLADPVSTSCADYYPTMNTSADPHTNCTIIGLAYQLLVDGGTHPQPSGKPNIHVIGLGAAEAQQVAWRALTVYATAGETYQSFKAATAAAAYDRGGRDEENKVDFAWDAVGVPYATYNAHEINASIEGYVGSSGITMGFVLSGSGSQSMLIRAAGPALSSFGISGNITNPYLTLYNSSASVVASNDDWSSASNASLIAGAAIAVGAFAYANPSNDSAILESLSSGSYSAVITGVSGATGVTLGELYPTSTSGAPNLINMSALGQITSSANMSEGFIVNGTANKEVLLRLAGPALAASPFNMSGTISAPTLTLYWIDSSGSSHQLYSNTGWGNAWNSSDISGAASSVGAFSFASGSTDCALLVSLPPGTYTAVGSGVSGSTGVSMIEIYDVQ